MLEVLKFIFDNPCNFIGVAILLGIIFDGIASIVKAFCVVKVVGNQECRSDKKEGQ